MGESADLGDGAGRGLPTWLLRGRAPGSVESRDYRVAARSLLQAEAILRRKGLEVESASGRRVDGPADDLSTVRMAPGPLRCTRCGYVLDGLTVREAVLDCPECGFPQVVLAYVADAGRNAEEQARGVTGWGWGGFSLGCLAGVFLTLFGLFSLLVVAAGV